MIVPFSRIVMNSDVKKVWLKPDVCSISIKSETTKGQSKGAYETFSNPNNPGPYANPKAIS